MNGRLDKPHKSTTTVYKQHGFFARAWTYGTAFGLVGGGIVTAASQVAYKETEVKKILAIRCEEEDVEMAEDALDLLTRYVCLRYTPKLALALMILFRPRCCWCFPCPSDCVVKARYPVSDF